MPNLFNHSRLMEKLCCKTDGMFRNYFVQYSFILNSLFESKKNTLSLESELHDEQLQPTINIRVF